jgi:chorismate mutase-like protein
MSVIPSDLATLRRRIDDIDDRLHDLLVERAEVVCEVAASKKDGEVAFYQPGREAQILRRLVARHHGALPVGPVVRIWREMLAATVRIETPFAVAVFAPAEAPGFWDLARDHYGSHAPMSACRSAGQVIRAVAEGDAAVGVLPVPREGDPDPWWRHLAPQDDGAPRVIARLPFGPRGNVRDDAGDAIVVGHCTQQETGADRTLFASETAVAVSRARLFDVLASAGLACTFFASCEHREGSLNLFEIDGFVPAADPRIGRFRAQLGAGLYRLLPLGGYALPLAEAPLAPGAEQEKG